MAGVNASLMALVAAGVLALIGFAALYVMRGGFSLIASKGNPREKAMAISALEAVGWGVVIAGGAALIGTFLVNTLKFS